MFRRRASNQSPTRPERSSAPLCVMQLGVHSPHADTFPLRGRNAPMHKTNPPPRSDTADAHDGRWLGCVHIAQGLAPAAVPRLAPLHERPPLSERAPASKCQLNGVQRLSSHRQQPGSAAAKCTGYFRQNGVSVFVLLSAVLNPRESLSVIGTSAS